MTSRWPLFLAFVVFVASIQAHAMNNDIVIATIKEYVPLQTASVKNCVSRVVAEWVNRPASKEKTVCDRSRPPRTLSEMEDEKKWPFRVVLKYRDGEMYSNKTVIVATGWSSIPEDCLESHMERQIKHIHRALAYRMCARFDGSDRLQLAELPEYQAPRGGTLVR